MNIPIDFKRIVRYFSRDRAWQATVVIFMLLFVVLVSANIYFYLKLLKSVESQIETKSRFQEIRRDRLMQAVKGLEEKEKRLNQNILIKPDISDPSL